MSIFIDNMSIIIYNYNMSMLIISSGTKWIFEFLDFMVFYSP